MQTLKDKYPEAYATLKRRGYKNICTLMECLGKPSEIDKALGYNAAASHWMTRRNTPSWHSEGKAGAWIAENWDSNDKTGLPLESYSNAAIEFQIAKPIVTDDFTHVPPPSKPEPDADGTFLAIIPHEKLDKAIKIMALIGVELVEV